jgi:hypothetical protein
VSAADELGARVVPFSDVLVYQDKIARLWKRVETAEAENERLRKLLANVPEANEAHSSKSDEMRARAEA